MAYENILVETRDRVAIITLNRPQRLNALSDALADEMEAASATAMSPAPHSFIVVIDCMVLLLSVWHGRVRRGAGLAIRESGVHSRRPTGRTRAESDESGC